MSAPEASSPAAAQIQQLAAARFISKPLYIAAKLGIADLLTSQALPIEELARRTQTDASALYRVMRCLASVGVFREVESRSFELTPQARLLVSGKGSVRPLVLWLGDPRIDHVWENFLWSVQTGKTAIEKTHGKPLFEWLKDDDELAQIFNDAMSANATIRYASVAGAYDFSSIKKLVDVGGGHGALMERILAATPGLRGVVYDQPAVVAGAAKRMAAAGLSDRCEAVGGDMFCDAPAADAHMASLVLHDWDDERCIAILQNCQRACAPGGRFLIIEMVTPGPNEPSFAKMLDMQMLALAGGRERTEPEYAALLDRAGYRLNRLVPTRGPVSVLEGIKV
jgi:ubiquinone/menaquinone biosynthesis C-methylase UbiE